MNRRISRWIILLFCPSLGWATPLDLKQSSHRRLQYALLQMTFNPTPWALRPLLLTGPGHMQKKQAIDTLIRAFQIHPEHVFRPGSQLKLLFSLKLQQNPELNLALQISHLQRLIQRISSTHSRGLVVIESCRQRPPYLTDSYLEALLRLHFQGESEISPSKLIPAQLLIAATCETCWPAWAKRLREQGQAFHFPADESSCMIF